MNVFEVLTELLDIEGEEMLRGLQQSNQWIP